MLFSAYLCVLRASVFIFLLSLPRLELRITPDFRILML